MRQGKFLFLSGENEQFPGLLAKLKKHDATYAIINGMDEHDDFFRLVKDFKDVVAKFRPDFVTVQTNWQLAIVAFARLIFGLRYSVVYVIHGYRHNYQLRSYIARFTIGLALFLFADHVIAPSSFLKNKFNFLRDKVKVIFIGEDEKLFEDHPLPSFDGKLKFIFGGMFRTGKNQDLLIRALRKYIDKSGNNNVELYLPGDGPLLEQYRQLTRDLSIEDKVIFPGLVNRDDMLPMYLQCQFAFAPTNVETFGHCIAEPFVLGRVLFTRHTGVADDVIKHGENGFFFDDENDLIDVLLKALPDKKLCENVAKNTRKARDLFRWEVICSKHFELIFEPLFSDTQT